MADAATAREQAREILSQRRFADSEVPRPFEKPLGWLGDRIDDAGRGLARLFASFDAALPGGRWVVWLLLGTLVAVIAVVLARSAIRRRGVAPPGAAADPAEPPPDPAELERRAAQAEAAGDYAGAVRLRFAAGVVALQRERVLGDEGALTTGAISTALGSEAFDGLGRTFDAIAYGGREARPDDARASRETWPVVLGAAR